MEHLSAPTRLDVKALAQSGQEISGTDALSNYARLAQDLRGQSPDLSFKWIARGEERLGTTGKAESWLHLSLDAALPLVCQRCLGPVDVHVSPKRLFRFVASEAEATAQDDNCDEDLLVLSREFNLAELIEDELVLEVPLIPRHDICPVSVKLAVADADFADSAVAKPSPFAALSALVTVKPPEPK